MPELIMNNLMRRIGRTVLTALGVGLGVATIVALLSVSDGLTQTAAGFVHLGGSDLGVFQANVSDPTASILPTSLVRTLERNPDVASATPLLLIVGKVPADPAAFVFGADPSGFFARRLVFAAGGPPASGSIAVGDGLAASQRLRPGARLLVDGHRFTVSGVYHSGIDPQVRALFSAARAFVTPYAATGIDEYFAEALRAYVEANDATSVWPSATRERLTRIDPAMCAYVEALFATAFEAAA